MNKKIIIRLAAVVLSVCVATGSLIFSNIKTTASKGSSSVINNSGFRNVTVDDFTDNQKNFATNIPFIEQLYNNGEKSGVSLNFNGGSYERTVFTSCKYNIDGFYFKIASITKENNALESGSFCIMASPTQDTGRFIILFDTNTGEVSYFNSSVEKKVLLTHQKLTYDILSRLEFTVGFRVNENKKLTLEIDFNDGAHLEAEIPTEYACVVDKNANSSYIGVSPYNSSGAMAIKISGIKSDRFTRPTSSTLITTVNDGKNQLINGNLDCFPNGMYSSFYGTDIGSRHVSAEKYNIDGLRLRFNELKKNTGYESTALNFAVSLTDDKDSIGAVRLMLDTQNGTLGYYTVGTEAVTIIKNEKLLYENIKEQEFIIGFDAESDGGYTVFISIGTASRLYGKLPFDFCSALVGEAAYFTVSPANTIGYFTVKITGVYVEGKSDGYTVPDKFFFRTPSGYTENLPQKANVHNGWQFKGTRLTFNGGDVGKFIVSEEKYNFDGLTLRFDNLTKNAQASGALRFTILAADEVNSLGKFRIMVDTETGTISYYNATTSPVVFLQNDLLKFENLSRSDFEIAFSSQSDGSMKCSVRLKNEKIIYGFIPSAFCKNLSKNVGASYIMIAPGKAMDNAQYYFSLDVTGIKYNEYTIPSGNVLRKIVGAGNTLSNKTNGGFPLGETSTFTNADITKRQCSREKYNINGLTLLFDNLSKTATNADLPVLAIRLTEDVNANSGITLFIDTEKGELSLNSTENVLISSDVLEYDRINNRKFSITFNISEGVLKGTINVSGYEDVCFEIESSYSSEELYFAIAAGMGNYSFMVTLCGILKEENYIDNSWLLPQYKCDDLVEVDTNGTPEWLSSAIIGEANVSVFGTFYDMIPVLDYCAETGINALWITPINDKGVNGNGYSSMGMHTIDPYLTGILEYGEEWRQLTDEEYNRGWEVYAEFIEQAHKRNIRILYDVVSFGVLKESPLIKQHPDWFKGNSQESTCNDFNWSNSELIEWHINNIADIALKTGVDGLRFDSEPMITGYEVNRRLKNTLLSKGRKLIYMAEARNNDNTVYDLSEGDVQGPDYISVKHFESLYSKVNIVDSVKSGKWIGAPEAQDIHQSGDFKYYTFQLCCHDSHNYGAQGNRFIMGYETLFSPFVPFWVLGEEMNNDKDGDWTRILYLNALKTADLREPEKRDFYESVKKMIELRRKNSDIFESFSDNHKNANICKVDTAGGCGLQAYARYSGNRGAVIVPNNTEQNLNVTVKPRFYEMGISGYPSYTVTDLKTDKIIAEGTEEQISEFSVNVSAEDTGIILITAKGTQGEIKVEPVPDEPEDNSDYIEYIPDTFNSFAPDTTDFLDFSKFWNSNIPSIQNIAENGVHKGVRMTFNGSDVGRRITTSGKYNVDGLSIKLDALTKNQGAIGNPNITVMLSTTTELDKFRIMIDTNDGTLSYYNGTVTPVVIASSSLLKYDILSKHSFTVSFEINPDGAVMCWIKIYTIGFVKGVIPKSFAEEISNFGNNPLHIVVGPGKAYQHLAYYFSVNVVGIEDNRSQKPQDTLFNSLVSNTVAKSEGINYGNTKKGVKLTFNGCNIGGVQMYRTPYALDGLKLCFDDLEKNIGYEENLLKFSICIGNDGNALPRFRVVFDTMNGTISYYSGDNPYGELVTVARDNILKYKNLRGNPFNVIFKVLAGGDISVNFTLNNKTVTGIIPKAFYDRYIIGENIYFGVSTSNKNGYFSLVLSGIERVKTLSFKKDWYSMENIYVSSGADCRLPVAQNKAGHHFFGWQDANGKLYTAGSRLNVLNDTYFKASVAYPGDVDLNGQKDSYDIALLVKCLLGAQNNVNSTADSNCDSNLNVLDFITLKKIISN
ncbi:MAG: hypothetical protein IKK24_02765 [Clostridia bacterium]|nr:hypothetical protein [Clostridia bacterium]